MLPPLPPGHQTYAGTAAPINFNGLVRQHYLRKGANVGDIQEVRGGLTLEQAVVKSAVVRAKPIALTAVAAMAGAVFILDDPVFSGLAVSLLFGLFVSTVLTLVVIPVVYYGVMRNRVEWIRTATG